MTLLDGLKPVFLEALSFADERTRAALIEKWSLECQAVYDYKKQLIVEAYYKAAHNGSEWISVEERLPTWEDGKVLIYTPYGISIAQKTTTNHWKGDNAIPKLITHWMPLPEGPKGGEE